MSGICFGLVQVCRRLFRSEEGSAEPLSHARGDPTDFSPTGVHYYQLVREVFPCKIPGFYKYRGTLCLLTPLSPSSFNLCLLWGLQPFTDSLHPKTSLFALPPCPTSLSSVSSFSSLASQPQSLLPQLSLLNKFSGLLCHLTCSTAL